MLLSLIAGQQKAVVGGFSSGVLALLAQVGVSGDISVKDALVALGAWIFTHAVVYFTKNA